MVNAVAPVIEPALNTITAVLESIFHEITRVCPYRTTNDEQDDCNNNCYSDIHSKSPLYP
jgi:hypothetical protein